MLTGTYRIKSNVPLAQLQRNRAGEFLHISLAAAQESLSLGYRPGLTWTCLCADQPLMLHERERERLSFCITYCQHMRLYGYGARV